jgi:hypothetical protein
MGSCSCAQFVPRAPFGAVNIVHKIALLPRALFYSASCSICWSINLRLPRAKLVIFWDTAPVSATAGDTLRHVHQPFRTPVSLDSSYRQREKDSGALVGALLDRSKTSNQIQYRKVLASKTWRDFVPSYAKQISCAVLVFKGSEGPVATCRASIHSDDDDALSGNPQLASPFCFPFILLLLSAIQQLRNKPLLSYFHFRRSTGY